MFLNKENSDGLKTGYCEEYHSNGQLMLKGNYQNGLMIGYWEYYHDNGDLDEVIFYF